MATLSLDRLVREQADLLDDVADPAAQLHRVGRGDVLAVEQDPPAGRLDSRLTILIVVVLPQPDGPTSDDQLARRDVEVSS